MGLSQDQRANLAKLAAYLETLPDDYERFAMRHYFCGAGVDEQVNYALRNGGVPCGAVACALGHGPAAGILVPAELVTSRHPDWNAYAKLFVPSVSTLEYDWCFYDDWAHFDDTPRGAAARIRYLLERGRPPRSFEGSASQRHLRTYAPFLASVDTRPKDGDAKEAPLASGAVPAEERADAQPNPSPSQDNPNA